MEKSKKLFRSRTEKWVAGVAGGLAEYFSVDPLIIRLIFVILALANGVGILIYIIMAILIPLEAENAKKETEADKKKEPIEERISAVKDEIKQSNLGWSAILGIIIIVIGILFFLQNFSPFQFLAWKFLWPVALIILGLLIILRKAK